MAATRDIVRTVRNIEAPANFPDTLDATTDVRGWTDRHWLAVFSDPAHLLAMQQVLCEGLGKWARTAGVNVDQFHTLIINSEGVLRGDDCAFDNLIAYRSGKALSGPREVEVLGHRKNKTGEGDHGVWVMARASSKRNVCVVASDSDVWVGGLALLEQGAFGTGFDTKTVIVERHARSSFLLLNKLLHQVKTHKRLFKLERPAAALLTVFAAAGNDICAKAVGFTPRIVLDSFLQNLDFVCAGAKSDSPFRLKDAPADSPFRLKDAPADAGGAAPAAAAAPLPRLQWESVERLYIAQWFSSNAKWFGTRAQGENYTPTTLLNDLQGAAATMPLELRERLSAIGFKLEDGAKTIADLAGIVERVSLLYSGAAGEAGKLPAAACLRPQCKRVQYWVTVVFEANKGESATMHSWQNFGFVRNEQSNKVEMQHCESKEWVALVLHTTGTCTCSPLVAVSGKHCSKTCGCSQRCLSCGPKCKCKGLASSCLNPHTAKGGTCDRCKPCAPACACARCQTRKDLAAEAAAAVAEAAAAAAAAAAAKDGDGDEDEDKGVEDEENAEPSYEV
jgi:hypothetical protein